MRQAKKKKSKDIEGEVAGNKEMTHERLLEVSRLDGRKRGRKREGGKKASKK